MQKPVSRLCSIIILFVGVLTSCKEESNVGDVSSKDSTTVQDTTTQSTTKTKFFFQSLPSPLHIAHIFKRAGVKYEQGVTNSPDNASKYQSDASKALNLGVYSADLAYYTINNETQETIKSLKAARGLADGLGIVQVYEAQNLIARFESNIGNRDSLLGFLSDLAVESDILLKQGERYDIVFLSFAGAWVESMYIASHIASKSNNQEIMQRVISQRASLDNLIELLKEYKGRSEFDELIVKLSEVSSLLATMAEKHNAASASGADGKVSPEDFAKFKSLVTTLRQEIVAKV
jgi:hypothetical protein